MNNLQAVTPPPDRLVPLREAVTQVGYRSRTSLYRDLQEDPRFPAPIYRGRNVFFLASELNRYVHELAGRARAGEQIDQKRAGQQTAARLNQARQSKSTRWRERHVARLASQQTAKPKAANGANGDAS